MSVSVTDAISGAFQRTKLLLFSSPFDLERWMVLGFAAFLMQLGRKGATFNFNVPGGGGHRSPGAVWDDGVAWVAGHVAVAVILGCLSLTLALSLALLLLWLSSRGRMIFLDGVLSGRIAIREPWRRLAALSNSLLLGRIVLGLASLCAIALYVLVGGVIALPDILSHRFGIMAVIGIAVVILLEIPTAILVGICHEVLWDFVSPIMYRYDLRIGAAIGVFRSNLLPGRLGAFVLFYLMKIVLVVAASALSVMACCATCCLVALPYIGSVILLPVTTFITSYSLCFLEQFGESFRMFAWDLGGSTPVTDADAGNTPIA